MTAQPSSPTGPDHDLFAHDAAAYTLDALDPADRRAFTAHLATCRACQEQVSEFSDLPPLLDIADPALWMDPVEAPPDTLLPRLLREVSARRRASRFRIGLVAAVAACILTLLAVLGISALSHHEIHSRQFAFTPVSSQAAGVSASVTLTPQKDGTALRVVCAGESGGGGPYGSPDGNGETYQLVVVNKAGARQTPTNWQPNRPIDTRTSTNWPERAISKIEINDGHTGQTLMQVVF
jgi:hypothetical protein